MAIRAEPFGVPTFQRGNYLARAAIAAASVRQRSTVRTFLFILMTLYVAKQGINVIAFKPFTGHDEIAHYAYLRTVATEGRIPVLPDLDEWRAAVQPGAPQQIDQLPTELYQYCDYTLNWFCDTLRFRDQPPRMVTYLNRYYPDGFQYAANHPPLYYVIMTPLYWASDRFSPETQQYLLRGAAIPFGLATVVLAFLLARTLFPGDRFLAMAAPTFVAFQPQISYEASMVNNDIVAIALYSLILYLVIVGVRDRFPVRITLLIGLALGLALLTKGTALTVAPVIGFAILLSVGWKNVRGWIGRGALVVAPAAVLAAPWYLFLYRTYGNLDGLDQIEALQYWNNPAGTFFGMLTDRQFVVMRFRETWGEFGWRDIPLSTTLLWMIAIPIMLATAGLVRYLFIAVRREPPETTDPVPRLARWQWIGLAMLGLVCVISYLAVIQFGTRFALTQARYFFPAINAGTLLLMLGLRTIIPKSFHGYAQGALFAALFLLNAVILTQYVIPHYLSL